MRQQHVDVAIIGSGVGGGSVALQLAGSGASVLEIERSPLFVYRTDSVLALLVGEHMTSLASTGER